MNTNSRPVTASTLITASADSIMAHTMPALPSLKKSAQKSAQKSPITLRGIPQEQILRTLAESVTATPVAALAEDIFMLQHISAAGLVGTQRVTRAAARRALATYTATRGVDGERLHVRKAGGPTDGTLVGAYRAEGGRWIAVAAF